MADDLQPLLLEMQRVNKGVNQLVGEARLDDTPKQLLAGNIFEILNARDLFGKEKELISKVIQENQESSNFLEILTTSRQDNPLVNLLEKVNESIAIVFTKTAAIIDAQEKNMTGFLAESQDGVQVLQGGLMKSNTEAFKQIGSQIELVFSKNRASDKEKEKDEKVAQDNRFTKLSRGFTKGFKNIGEKFDKLTSGIIGKIGLVTILTLLVVAFAKNFKPFGLFVVAALDVIRRFVSDLSMVLTGEMGFGEFLKNNLVAIAGGFIFLFRKFIIKKLFGGLVTRIGAAIRLVGQTAGSKLALAGKLFLKILGRFFLVPMLIFKAISGFFQGYQKKILEGGTFLEALGAGFLGALQNVFDFLADGVMFIIDALKGFFNPIINAITGGLKSAYNFFKDLVFGDDVEGRFMGGPVVAGSPYVVGERGPELFVPGAAGGIVPGLGGGAVVVNNNQINQANSTSNHNHSSISVTDRQQERVGL